MSRTDVVDALRKLTEQGANGDPERMRSFWTGVADQLAKDYHLNLVIATLELRAASRRFPSCVALLALYAIAAELRAEVKEMGGPEELDVALRTLGEELADPSQLSALARRRGTE